MNIYPWYIFITVAEQKSFIKAAGELNISQSAVSHAIAKLESECGYPLFIRNRNSIALTSSGQSLLPFVRQFLNCDNALTQEVAKLKNIQSGGVKVAAFHSATLLWLPEIIKDFQKEYPGVEIVVRQSGDKDINQMIQNGEIDLAIVSKEAIGSGTPFLPLHQTPVVGVTPKGYRPVNGTALTPEDFRTNDMVLPLEGYDTEMNQYLNASGLRDEAKYRIEDDDTIFAYVEQGFGLSIMPLMTAQCSKREFETWPLTPQFMRIIGLVSVYSDYISPSAALFRQKFIYYMTRENLINL